MKCITLNQGRALLDKIHGGLCGAHTSYCALVGKVFRQGFYWPTALQDAIELVKRCSACQFQSRKICQPTQALPTIPLSWPFVTWGLDLLGPFPTAPGRFKFLIMSIDTFTKWIKAEPLTKITAAAAQRLVQCNIFTRFGVPSRIITDNGSQFSSRAFMDFCAEHGAVGHS